MNQQAKKCKVTIFGESYTLVSDESEQHLVESAHAVNKLMSEVSGQAGLTDIKRLAILVALQFSSELKLHLEDCGRKQERLNSLLDQELEESTTDL